MDAVAEVVGRDCRRCGLDKAASEFYRNPRGKAGLSSWCKACHLDHAKIRRQTVPRMRQKARESAWRGHGFTLSYGDYETMVTDQAGVCAVCGQPQPGHRNGQRLALAVDHDHQTGVVRGLLCNVCNTTIGGLERLDALAPILQYLVKHGSSLVTFAAASNDTGT